MKKYSNNAVKAVLPVLLFSFIAFTANAQKLPNVQKVSVRAPANIKIDGKATEWNDQFQAYNHATDIYYTLSNDDNNLYLIVRATNPRDIQKILAVGVCLVINNAGKQNDKAKENRSVTYPVISFNDGIRIVRYAGLSNVDALKGLAKDTVHRLTDSLLELTNKTLIASSKEIEIKGLSGIADTTISVYNEQRIRVAQAFDIKQIYTYELSIPLSRLGLSIDHPQKFSYQIKLISRRDANKGTVKIIYRYSNTSDEPININMDLDATTNFWGEYTLAKK